jgi:hypothetical protein
MTDTKRSRWDETPKEREERRRRAMERRLAFVRAQMKLEQVRSARRA